jgi:hypothetical protein
MPNIRDLDALQATIRAIFDGKYKVRLREKDAPPGRRHGSVIDLDGEIIGSASDGTYEGRGFAVHTNNFAGYIPNECIEFVD